MVGEIYGSSSHEIILMQGEAVLGLEAAARSLVRQGRPASTSSRACSARGLATGSAAIGADLHEIEMPYDEAVTGEAVDAYLSGAPRDRGRGGGPLRDAVAARSTRSGTSDPSPGATARSRSSIASRPGPASSSGPRSGSSTCSWRDRRSASAAHQACRCSRSVSRPGQPSRPTRMRHEARSCRILDWRDKWHGKGSFPVHAVGLRPQRRARRLRRAAGRGPGRLDRPPPARVRRLLGRRRRRWA